MRSPPASCLVFGAIFALRLMQVAELYTAGFRSEAKELHTAATQHRPPRRLMKANDYSRQSGNAIFRLFESCATLYGVAQQ